MKQGIQEDPSVKNEVRRDSQFALMSRKFGKHKAAVISGLVLLMLYIVAAFSGFFAPYGANSKDLDYAYLPPQELNFSLSEGLHSPVLTLQEDPVTLRKYYLKNEEESIPLGFFVRGEAYSLFGVFECDRHFFGVNIDKWAKGNSSGEVAPRFALLGTDRYGRDMLSKIVHGSRISLSIGLVAIVITFILGVAIGGVSGYFGGTTDVVIQRVIEIINSFPQLPLWLAIGAILPDTWTPLKVYLAITIVLSFLNWTGLGRVVRGKILSLRNEDYVVAAKLMGASHGRIIFKHLLPGFASHIIVTLTLSVPGMILGETALSFLGLGLRAPIISWGVLLQDCLNLSTISNYPWLLMPVVMIVLTVLCFNFLGDGLRDAADPYSSKR
ncbi:ABC transporter permease [Pelagicoccus mobilis]|uniref:ABC transporter permease n=1 Tax=Pelagicoccus mobilis TaxID=415221 RepID=A0A934S3T6_9BACT|nr:ABC transporter permease [Pelagicoccus mobilis]MBK1878523.1 ABC transporter permease [Pelagicoccus mobilis]